jgi:hypothetical protein
MCVSPTHIIGAVRVSIDMVILRRYKNWCSKLYSLTEVQQFSNHSMMTILIETSSAPVM